MEYFDVENFTKFSFPTYQTNRLQSFLFSFCSVVCSFASVILCSRIPGLTQSQRQLCAESPDALVALGAGHILGSQECQFQFKGKIVR